MALPRLSDPFDRMIGSQDYVGLSGTLAELEKWTNMLPRFGDEEISQITPYLKSKTKELANRVLAGTPNEQTRTLERLSVLRQGRLGDIEQCKDYINDTFRAQLQILSGVNAASPAPTPNAASSSFEAVSALINFPFSTASQSFHNTSSELSIPLLAVRFHSNLFVYTQYKDGPYHLTTMLGQYTICQQAIPNSIVMNFHAASVAAITWDKKLGMVTVKLVKNDFGWILEFERGEDAKAFAHAFTS